MDTKNVITAISLSVAVIILYSLFFGPSPEEIKNNQIKQEQIKQEQTQKSSDTPSLDQNENLVKSSRKEALTENERVLFENNSVVGSISLKGATIDDLTFKEYTKIMPKTEEEINDVIKKLNSSNPVLCNA